MEVKTQEQVLKLYLACEVIISIQRNEKKIQDLSIRSAATWFRTCSVSYRILWNGSMGVFQITIWTTHLNNGIAVSANEIACNWILKKIHNTHWHSDGILRRILIGSYPESSQDPTKDS